MTLPTRAVLEVLLVGAEDMYGAEIAAQADLATGTVHPILARLESNGWVSSEWEDVDTHEAGRPRRRFYRLTGEGRSVASDVLARPHAARRAPTAPRPAWGEAR